MVESRVVHVSSRGQLNIPQELRNKLGLQSGDAVVLHLLSNRMLLAEVAEPSAFEQAASKLRTEVKRRGITRARVKKATDEARQEVYGERDATAGGL